jgi:YfiH family protein
VSDSLLPFEWKLPHGVRAAFTTRLGGVSAAPWDSFNVGAHVGDEPAAVAANRERLRSLLNLKAEPAWLNQVHGIAVANLDRVGGGPKPLTADAAITQSAGKACVIMVADCLPVLFASGDGEVIAAAHAGWRGLVAGVLERTVAAMRVTPSGITAWLGPAISQRHFEVGEDVREVFVAADARAAAYFVPNEQGRWQADLIGLARRRLALLGIESISGGEWCTFADRERFFSHRRDGHLHDGQGGRMAALIWRTP